MRSSRDIASQLVFDPFSPSSLSARARASRWQQLLANFPELRSMTVLDMGGTEAAWERAPVRPARLVLLNTLFTTPPTDTAVHVVGDVCDAPPALRKESFDLVYSNSVIEHLGGHERRKRFADNVRSLGCHHWIQTPYRYFPIEPHWFFPGFQFLPTVAKAAVSERWPLGHFSPHFRGDPTRTVDVVLEVELLDRTSFQRYFPDSQVVFERVLGLPKSLVAVR